MTKEQIQLLEYVDEVELANECYRGRSVTVKRYIDPKSGQTFDLHERTGQYRQTPANIDSIVQFGEWRKLA